MGFNALFDIKCSLERVLCLELVKALDMNSICIFVKGESIAISYHDVGMVFNLLALGILTYLLYIYDSKYKEYLIDFWSSV